MSDQYPPQPQQLPPGSPYPPPGPAYPAVGAAFPPPAPGYPPQQGHLAGYPPHQAYPAPYPYGGAVAPMPVYRSTRGLVLAISKGMDQMAARMGFHTVVR